VQADFTPQKWSREDPHHIVQFIEWEHEQFDEMWQCLPKWDSSKHRWASSYADASVECLHEGKLKRKYPAGKWLNRSAKLLLNPKARELKIELTKKRVFSFRLNPQGTEVSQSSSGDLEFLVTVIGPGGREVNDLALRAGSETEREKWIVSIRKGIAQVKTLLEASSSAPSTASHLDVHLEMHDQGKEIATASSQSYAAPSSGVRIQDQDQVQCLKAGLLKKEDKLGSWVPLDIRLQLDPQSKKMILKVSISSRPK
jgi:hypothetical protein